MNTNLICVHSGLFFAFSTEMKHTRYQLLTIHNI